MAEPEDLLFEASRTRLVDLRRPELFPDFDLALTSGAGLEKRADLPIWNDLAAAGRRIGRLLDLERGLCELQENGRTIRLELPASEALQRLLDGLRVVLDISGLPLRVWAPMVQAGLQHCPEFKVVYAEPEAYKAHKSPEPTVLYDLSERVMGIEPIPGFAKLSAPARETPLLVLLLGFEGARARHIAESFEDPTPKIVPVIGAPGMKPEYPTQAVVCNQELLVKASYPRLRSADALCPFQTRRLLERVAGERGGYVYVSPLGTKPQALGAILFAIDHWQQTELIYDHPVPRAASTQGIGAVHEYDLKP